MEFVWLALVFVGFGTFPPVFVAHYLVVSYYSKNLRCSPQAPNPLVVILTFFNGEPIVLAISAAHFYISSTEVNLVLVVIL